jgi:hypothetical protein
MTVPSLCARRGCPRACPARRSVRASGLRGAPVQFTAGSPATAEAGPAALERPSQQRLQPRPAAVHVHSSPDPTAACIDSRKTRTQERQEKLGGRPEAGPGQSGSYRPGERARTPSRAARPRRRLAASGRRRRTLRTTTGRDRHGARAGLLRITVSRRDRVRPSPRCAATASAATAAASRPTPALAAAIQVDT